jgi:hypothetical protein
VALDDELPIMIEHMLLELKRPLSRPIDPEILYRRCQESLLPDSMRIISRSSETMKIGEPLRKILMDANE